MNTRSMLPALGMAAACLLTFALTPLSLAASPTIHHPEDGYVTIQSAVDAAGCGGKVLLAAGSYNERVLAPCGIQLIGAGVDATVINGTNLFDPTLPVIGFGHDPFAPFPSPFAEHYEVAHLTVQAGTNSAFGGIATGWTEDVSIHHVKIVGFSQGISIFQSVDVSIEHTFIQGPFFNLGSCIFVGSSPFRDQLRDGHMSGHHIHHNELTSCRTGIVLVNTVNATVHDNLLRQTNLGLQLSGVGTSEVYQNSITQSGLGMRFHNLNDSSIYQNTVCSVAGISFNTSTTPSLFDFPPSSNNTVQHNTFNQNTQNIVIADANIGPGNIYFKNESDLGLSCLP